MSLTAQPKKEIADFKLLLDVVESLNALRDPKALEARIKTLYAVSEAEEQKIENARLYVEQYNALSKEIAKEKSDIAERLAVVEAKGAAVTKKEVALAETQALHRTKLAEFKAAAEVQAEQAKATDKLAADTAKIVAGLDKRKEDLDAREAVIVAQEQSLRDKAKQLKELAGGL